MTHIGLFMTKVDPQAAPEIAAFLLGDTLRNPLEPPSDSSIAIRVSLDVGGAHPGNPWVGPVTSSSMSVSTGVFFPQASANCFAHPLSVIRTEAFNSANVTLGGGM